MILSVYQFEDSSVYYGMPRPENPEETPLATLILQNIKALDFISPMIYGKTHDGEEASQRRYEFKTFGKIKDGWELFHLYISKKEYFLEDKGYRYTPLGLQAIPLTYKTLSQLSKEEQRMIYRDFD